jgi:hypothetical protein
MDSGIPHLKATLDELARVTWTDIADGRRLGIGMGEVGITDHNMLTLRREHPSLIVHKHTAYEEIRTGADWEWWIDTAGGWLCLVFQAKILDANGRYAGITKGQTEGKPQVDVLIRSCLLRSERLNSAVWPLYCFYNSWRGGWPDNVERFDGADPQDMPDVELRKYGCAVTAAWGVRRVLVDPQYSNRRTLRNSYLPACRPWSKIFPDQIDLTERGLAQSMLTVLSSWAPGRAQVEPILPPGEADHTSSRRLVRRNRLAIYSDPTPLPRPPEYVLDLLDGRVQPRRIKPLARRIVIFPDAGL